MKKSYYLPILAAIVSQAAHAAPEAIVTVPDAASEIRPAYEQETTQVTQEPARVLAARAAALVGGLKKVGFVDITPEQANDLVNITAGNKGVGAAISAIITNHRGPTGKVEHVQEINTLRLKLLTHLSGIDPMDPKLLASVAKGDEVATKRLTFALIVTQLQLTGLSSEARMKILTFLTKLSEYADQAPPEEALIMAQDDLQLSEDMHIPVENAIAAARSSKGVTVIFAGRDDVIPMKIAGPGGKPLELPLSRARAEAIRVAALEKAAQIIEAARTPGEIGTEMANNGLRDLDRTVADSKIFIEKNTLLDANSEGVRKSREAGEEVATTAAELIEKLAKSGDVDVPYTTFEKVQLGLRAAPVIGSWASKYISDPLEEAHELRKDIDRLTGILVDGAKKAEEVNNTLKDLQIRALKRLVEIKERLAEAKIIADAVQNEVNELRLTDGDAADLLAAEAGTRVSERLNALSTSYIVLSANIHVLKGLVTMGELNINRAMELIDQAMPLLSLNQTNQIVAKFSKRLALVHKQIRDFTQDQAKKTVESLRDATEAVVEGSNEALMDPAVLRDISTQMKDIMAQYNEKMAAQYARNQEVGQELITVVNGIDGGAGGVMLGRAVNKQLSGRK